MTTTLYHNPRCSKSRAAKALLEEKNITFNIVEYLKTPLKASEIKKLIDLLGIEPHDLLRHKEAEYKEANLSKSSTKTDIVKAIEAFPKLLERPIVVNDRGARIGRPTEAINEIL